MTESMYSKTQRTETDIEKDGQLILSEEVETEEEVSTESTDNATTHFVVGIGASAGGLEALQFMVANLPTDTGMSFVIAQHLSPSYKSMIVDLLEKDSTIPIQQARHESYLQPNTIYICPPNYNIEINRRDQIILTSTPQQRQFPHPSVDLLFESIAIAKKENAIGIVLSGTGSDGARGIRAIKGEGGFGIVQDPSTAKYDGMPNASINNGNIDLILSPEEIGIELKNILKFPRATHYSFEETSISRDNYQQILKLVNKHYNVDFSLYKETTILRRIERRMTTLRIPKIEDYWSYARDNAKEVELLFNDFLIGVTAFFRDYRAYETLHTHLQHYFVNKTSKVFRAWVPGCSTGEEAYSIAMLVSEVLGSSIEEYKVQIFATDIDKHAIEFARNGIYPESALQNVPDHYKRKYFTMHNDHYEVIKPIKSNLIFSVHNLVNDPPFLRLDLLSCRNLLIYFNLELQRQLIPVFHYALNPKGLLFLGQSESIGVFHEQFKPVSRTSKVYEAVFLGKKQAPVRNLPFKNIEDYLEPTTKVDKQASQNAKPSFENNLELIIHQKLTDCLFKYVILLNENLDIIYSKGQNPLLIRPDGQPNNNIYKNLHPSLTVDLRSGIHTIDTQVEQKTELVKTPYQKIKIGEKDAYARIILMRSDEKPGLGSLYLMFCQVDNELDIPQDLRNNVEDSDLISKEHERQLIQAKEQLQTVIEELETSNEEMQSMNEELQSSNEELQSSNEELETTNEELQSTNEELQTAYSELRVAYEDKEAQQSKLDSTISELNQTKQLLQEAEYLGNVGSFYWDLNSHKFSWSDGAYKIFQAQQETLSPSYEAYIGLAHPDDRKILEDYLNHLLEGKSQKPLTYRVQTLDKKLQWVKIEALVSFNDLKHATKVIGSLHNVTEKINHDKNEQQKDQLIDRLMEDPVAITIYDFDKEAFVHTDQTFASLVNKPLSEMTGDYSSDDFITRIHDQDRDAFIAYLSKLRKVKNLSNMTSSVRIKMQDNSLTQIHITGSPYQFDDNKRLKTCLMSIVQKPS